MAESGGLRPMKLTPKQLADRWQVSVRTLERMRAERRGPPWERLGYLVRYDLDEILKYEAKRARP